VDQLISGQLARQRGLDLSNLTNTSRLPTARCQPAWRGQSQVGREPVNGVDTTHYKANVDRERAVARSSGSTRRSLKRVIQTSGARKIPIDVWVDDKGFIRRVQYAQPSGAGRVVRVTMNLHDFGAPVSIKPPPADSVVDLQKALRQ
jgi:hypothetical protein